MSFTDNYAQFGDQIALIDSFSGQKLSYSQLDERIQQLIRMLPSSKVFVAVGCSNSIDTVVGYLACLRAGKAVVLYDSSLNQDMQATLFAKYKPEYVYLEGSLTLLSESVLPVHHDLAVCLSTSGSTGSPKLVKLTLANLNENAKSIISYLKLSKEDVAITSLPLHYSYGLSILNTHLSVGASVVLTNESIVSRAFWDAFNQYHVTSLSGVPYHYEIFERIRFRRMELPSLRYLTQAGGKLNQNLVKIFTDYAKEKEIPFFVMYGQTEASARIAWLPPCSIGSKPDSIGIPVPGGTIDLLDKNGQLIQKNDTVGELVYRGANVMMGYATCRGELANGDELNGILKTGDLARRDADGFFYIQGRLNRFLKLNGNRFGLDVLDDFFKQNNYDCVCGGTDNKLVVLTRVQSDVASIEQILSEKFNLHHTMYKVIWKEVYPVSSSGKIQYKQLEEMAC